MAGTTSFTATTSSACPLNNFSDALICSKKSSSLIADMQVPCDSTISEVAANAIYCNRDTISAHEIVKKQKELPATSAKIQVDEEKKLDRFSFPGIGAHFVLRKEKKNNWDIIPLPFPMDFYVRKLDFTSQTSNSFFKEMSIQGYSGGNVAIWVKFNKEDSTSISYLSNCGINLDWKNKELGCYKSNKSDTKLLFEILAKHNKIPENTFPLIKNLVENGDWRTVTPLKANEFLCSGGEFGLMTNLLLE